MPKVIEFPKAAPQWVSSRDCVRFFALCDGRVIPCFVTLEALMDHFPIGPVDPQGVSSLKAFQQNRSAIEQVARMKIETTQGKRTSEILLKSEDFPHAETGVATRRVEYLTSSESPEIRNDPALLSKVDQINSLLRENHVHMDARATAEWDLIPTSGEPLIQLVLKDDETEAEVNTLYTRADLSRIPEDSFALFQIWMNLRDARRDRLRQALEVGAGTGD